MTNEDDHDNVNRFMIKVPHPPLLILLEAEKTVLPQFHGTPITTNENVQTTATNTDFAFSDDTFPSDSGKDDDVNRGMEFVNSYIPRGIELTPNDAALLSLLISWFMIKAQHPPLLLLEAEKTVLANVQTAATSTDFVFSDDTFPSDSGNDDDVNRGMEFVNSYIPRGIELKPNDAALLPLLISWFMIKAQHPPLLLLEAEKTVLAHVQTAATSTDFLFSDDTFPSDSGNDDDVNRGMEFANSYTPRGIELKPNDAALLSLLISWFMIKAQHPPLLLLEAEKTVLAHVQTAATNTDFAFSDDTFPSDSGKDEPNDAALLSLLISWFMIKAQHPPLLLLEAEKTVVAQFRGTPIATNENVQTETTNTDFVFSDDTFPSDSGKDDYGWLEKNLEKGLMNEQPQVVESFIADEEPSKVGGPLKVSSYQDYTVPSNNKDYEDEKLEDNLNGRSENESESSLHSPYKKEGVSNNAANTDTVQTSPPIQPEMDRSIQIVKPGQEEEGSLSKVLEDETSVIEYKHLVNSCSGVPDSVHMPPPNSESPPKLDQCLGSKVHFEEDVINLTETSALDNVPKRRRSERNSSKDNAGNVKAPPSTVTQPAKKPLGRRARKNKKPSHTQNHRKGVVNRSTQTPVHNKHQSDYEISTPIYQSHTLRLEKENESGDTGLEKTKRHNTTPHRGGHFLSDDLDSDQRHLDVLANFSDTPPTRNDGFEGEYSKNTTVTSSSEYTDLEYSSGTMMLTTLTSMMRHRKPPRHGLLETAIRHGTPPRQGHTLSDDADLYRPPLDQQRHGRYVTELEYAKGNGRYVTELEYAKSTMVEYANSKDSTKSTAMETGTGTISSTTVTSMTSSNATTSIEYHIAQDMIPKQPPSCDELNAFPKQPFSCDELYAIIRTLLKQKQELEAHNQELLAQLSRKEEESKEADGKEYNSDDSYGSLDFQHTEEDEDLDDERPDGDDPDYVGTNEDLNLKSLNGSGRRFKTFLDECPIANTNPGVKERWIEPKKYFEEKFRQLGGQKQDRNKGTTCVFYCGCNENCGAQVQFKRQQDKPIVSFGVRDKETKDHFMN